MPHTASEISRASEVANWLILSALGGERQTDWGQQALRHEQLAKRYENSIDGHEAWLEAANRGNPGLRPFFRLSDGEVAAAKAAAGRHRELARQCWARARGEAA